MVFYDLTDGDVPGRFIFYGVKPSSEHYFLPKRNYQIETN